MSEVELKITPNAERFFERVAPEMEKGVEEGSFLAASLVMQGIRKSAPRKTGALSESHDEVTQTGRLEWIIGSDMPYASLIQRRTNYLNVGVSFVEAEMEKGVAKSLERAFERAKG